MITVKRVEEEAVKLTAEELCEELNQLKWQDGIVRFTITENFKKGGKRSYPVENLSVEMEDGVILFGDSKDVILNNNSVLMGFLETSLLSINRVSSQCYELVFPDGQVIIQGIREECSVD